MPVPSRRRLPAAVLAAATGLVAVLGLPGCDRAGADLSGADPDSVFRADVVPVLRDQCEDCHFSGGPMHAEMPFDDLAVVRSLEDELLARLDGKGRKLVAAWLDLVRERAAPPSP